QIDVDPVALQQNNVTLTDVFQAVKLSNLDVGARTIEINRVEYIVRGIGFIKNLQDIRYTVVKTVNNTPIYVKDIAQVSFGPAQRRGALDKEGAEAVGGVVVVRYGENPLAAINNVKEKIKEISPGLPQKQLPDGRTSQVTIVPFYDRSELIQETLGTLNNALRDEILITVIVILIMIMHFTASILITSLLPLTVLMVFIGMKLFGVDANIVALSGIAIAIGTIVDMGIVVSENILRHLEENKENPKKLKLIHQATSEVGGAVLTAVSTTIVSFLPVFTMVAAEGKLFKPLAYTKTLALICSIIITLTILPPFASLLFTKKINKAEYRKLIDVGIIVTGLISLFMVKWWFGLLVLLFGIFQILKPRLHTKIIKTSPTALNWIVIMVVAVILATTWAPLGRDKPVFFNFVFVALIISVVMGALMLFTKYYPSLLSWALDHKKITLAGPVLLIILGMFIWIGFGRIFGFMPHIIKRTAVYQKLNNTFPGLGREFMPPLDEGSYLYMPTTMAHAGMQEALDVLQKLDRALYSVPEVKHVVGKIGRVDSPLDPAP
ncbi:MAG: efflux RND transporter permease subunit, partial [bacterium]